MSNLFIPPPGSGVTARASVANLTAALVASATARPGVLICGDSIADAVSLAPMFYAAQQTTGVAGVALGAMTVALGGAASASVGNQALWLGGKTLLLSASGDYCEFTVPSGVRFQADTIHAFYVKSASAGSFKIQSSINGGAWTDEGSTIATANASTISAVTTVTKTSLATIRLRFVWVSGTVRLIGPALIDSTRGGVVLIGCSVAGSSFTDASAGVAATVDPVFATLAPKLAIVVCRDGAPSAASLTSTINAYESSGTRELDWVFVAMPPSDDASQTNAATLDYNAAVKSYALGNYRGFVDCYSPIGSLAEWLASGFNSDGLHMTTAGYQWLANTIWTGAGLAALPSAASSKQPVYPTFSVHKNGTNQTGIVSGVFTKLTWSTEEWDSEGAFASDAFTPLAAGKYRFTIAAQWDSVASGTRVLSLYKNGSEHKRLWNNSFGAPLAAVSVTAEANGSTDYFEVYVWHDSGTDRTINGTASLAYFQGERIAQ